ncbi:unnamed protein product, partial [Prorocentrum cordatum]
SAFCDSSAARRAASRAQRPPRREMGAQACCMSLRAPATAAETAAASPVALARAPPAPDAMVAPAPAAPAPAGAGPVLLPISRRRSRLEVKVDAGDNLPKAASPGAGAGGSASPAQSPGRSSRKSERRVTFGGEEMKQFEAVGRMRSVR